MELLIPGLILVALMVYASTRIKRAAARAFEAEQIEGDGFVLSKPDGFLHRTSGESPYGFDAYSREFGEGTASDVRAATAIVVPNDDGLDAAVSRETGRMGRVLLEDRFQLGDCHGALVSGELSAGGHDLIVSSKILERGGRVLALRVEALREPDADMACKIELMLGSFALK